MMLFTGLHHAREPLTININLYIMVKILFDVYHGIEMKNLLNGVVFWQLYYKILIIN
jgi:hypothetical protein